MWPFKSRKSGTKAVPPEVKQYYASEHRERVGLAWLIAFLSLIATVVVIAGLFFGGRWAYRKIANRNTTPSSGQTATNEPTAASSSKKTSSTNTSQANDLQPAAGSTPADNGSSNSSSSASNSGSNQPSSSRPSPGSSSSSSQTITDTGAGNTIAIFLGVTAVAASVHHLYLRRKQNIRV